MSTQRNEVVPTWTLGDRLRKARSLTGLTTRDFAAEIGVSHGTVTNAENDARGVRDITIKQWALVTGVKEAWLRTGEGEAAPTPPGPGSGQPVTDLDQLTKAKARRAQRTHRANEQYLDAA